MQPQENTRTTRASQLLLAPDPAPVSVTGLGHWAHQQVAPPVVHLHASSLTPASTAMYPWGKPADVVVHADIQGGPKGLPWPPPLSVSAASPSHPQASTAPPPPG